MVLKFVTVFVRKSEIRRNLYLFIASGEREKQKLAGIPSVPGHLSNSRPNIQNDHITRMIIHLTVKSGVLQLFLGAILKNIIFRFLDLRCRRDTKRVVIII
jgi:hypothetical protein